MQSLLEQIDPRPDLNSGWDNKLADFLQYYLEELHTQTDSSPMINFAQAAIVLQKSANIYEGKVDYLWELMLQLLNVLQMSKRSNDRDKGGTVEPEAQPTTPSKRTYNKKSQDNSLLNDDLDDISFKVSEKSLDLPDNSKNSSSNWRTKSAIFGRMVNVKKNRKHQLYVFDNNGESMGKKEDFRINWPMNKNCALVEDPLDELSSPAATGCNPVGRDVHENVVTSRSSTPLLEAPFDSPPMSEEAIPVSASDALEACPTDLVSAGPSGPMESGDNAAPNPADANTDLPGTFPLPDTPPDSGVEAMRGASPPQEDRPLDRSVLNTSLENVVAAEQIIARRNLRERQPQFDDTLYAINLLFSGSLTESLSDSAISDTASVAQKIRAQARRNRAKGKRLSKEILDGAEDVFAFEEVPLIDAPPPESTQTDGATPEVPQGHVPVPTPPPTPPNSQTLSPDRINQTPGGPGALSPAGRSPGGIDEDTVNVLEAYRPDENEQNDRVARVAAWHKSIKRRLEEADARAPFNVHTYGSKILTSFPSMNSTLTFKELVNEMDGCEVARVFLTSLMLANTQNVKLTTEDSSPLPVDCLSLTLLSTQRHEEELEAFCAPSTDVQRRSSGGAPQVASEAGETRKRQHPKNGARPKPSKRQRQAVEI